MKTHWFTAALFGLACASCATNQPPRSTTGPAVYSSAAAQPYAPEQKPVILPPSASTNEPPLPQIRSMYEKELRALDRAYERTIADAPTNFVIVLQNLENKFAADGQLENVLAVRTERARFDATRTLSPTNLVAAPPELLTAQKLYLDTPQRAETLLKKSQQDLHRQYFAALERLKVQLTKRKRISEAVDVDAELKRITPLVPIPLIPTEPPTVPLPEPKALAKPPATKQDPPADQLQSKPGAPVLPANLKTGLLAFYPLDGKGEDISGNNRHGAVRGPRPVVNRFGDSNAALSFDGKDDLVELDSRLASASVSICLWAKCVEGIGERELVRCGGHGFGIRQRGTSIIFFVYNSTPGRGGSYEYVCPRIVDGRWHHLALTYGPEGFAAYVDGIQRETSSKHGRRPVLYQSTVNFTIGQRRLGSESSHFFAGDVDDFGVWDRQLSAADVKQVHDLR
jgi:hypothetical protein